MSNSINTLTSVLYSNDIRYIIRQFLIERTSRGLSQRTIEFYTNELGYFCTYLENEGVKHLNELTPFHIREYLVNLAKHRNQGGVHCSYRSIKVLLNWWEEEVDEDYKNPIKKVKVSPSKIKPLPGITVDNIERMIKACTTENGGRDKAILFFLFDTGIRATEFISLNINDVDFITGEIIIKHGKGDKARTVYIGHTCRRVVKAYIKFREHGSYDPLFVTDDGYRFTYPGLREVIRRIAKRAGIKTPGLHDFRRAFALNMLRNRVDLLTISRLLGHSSLSVTERYVAQVNDDLRDAHKVGSPVDKLKDI